MATPTDNRADKRLIVSAADWRLHCYHAVELSATMIPVKTRSGTLAAWYTMAPPVGPPFSALALAKQRLS